MIIIYGLLILLGFMIYSNINSHFQRDKDAFYRNLGETAVKGIPYLSQDRSKYNLSQTVGEFFRKEAQQQYPEFNQVSAQQQQMLMDQIRDQFQQQFGINADANVTLRTAIVEVVTQRMREALGQYERFFPLVFTVLLIALMRTFSFVFTWVLLLVSWVFYKLMRAVKFFKITKETVEIEKLYK
jgi:hypothetical protein